MYKPASSSRACKIKQLYASSLHSHIYPLTLKQLPNFSHYLSGIIIVDFINMNQRNCDILMEHLKSLAKKDIVSTTIVDITKLGLVEITRKKIGKSLSESLNKA